MSYRDVVTADNPTFWWRCNEPGGQIAQSSVGSQPSAIGPGINTNTIQAPGQGGLGYSGIALDGGGLFVSRSSGFSAEMDLVTLSVGFAVEVWAAAPTGNNAFADVSGGHSLGFVQLLLHGVPYVNLFASNHTLLATATIGNGVGAYSCGGAVPLNDANYHHLVVAVGSTGASFYVDGASSFPNTGTFPTQSTHDFTLVIPGFSSPDLMVVSEIAIYNGGLTSTRAAAHYAAREIFKRPTWRQGLPSSCT